MKIFILSFVIFAVLQFGHAKSVKEPVLAEFRSQVLAKNALLGRAVEAYRKQGYYTMANLVHKSQLSDNFLNQLDKLPTDLSVDELDKASRLTFNSMQSFLFYFPLYNNASHLSDSLKFGALSVAAETMKQENGTSNPGSWRTYNILPMTSEYIIQKVVEIIHLEKDVLVNGQLEESSLELEKLYAILREINPWFGNSLFEKMEKMKLLHDRCDLTDSSCSEELKKAIGEYDVYDQQVKAYLPIDSSIKVDQLLRIFEPYAFLSIYDVLSDEDWCLVEIDGCEKKSVDN